MTLILPVIHHKAHKVTQGQAEMAFLHGADGVFVISHHNEDDKVVAAAQDLKRLYPDKLIGINLLNTQGIASLNIGISCGLDLVWDDAPGITGKGCSEQALAIAKRLNTHNLTPNAKPIAFMGSVAFKYQPVEPDPEQAAINAFRLGMIPTTSGTGTGFAPELDKIEKMYEAINSVKENMPTLAIASGMKAYNVERYLPYLTHILVSTGISVDDYHFCPAKLAEFINTVRLFSAKK